MIQGAVKVNGLKAQKQEDVPEIKDGDIVQIGKGQFFKISKKKGPETIASEMYAKAIENLKQK